MPATRPAKRQKRNAVEAIDSAGAGKKPSTLPSPASDLRAGEVKAEGLCFRESPLRGKLIWAEYKQGDPKAAPAGRP
jgi:hypothetical protein